MREIWVGRGRAETERKESVTCEYSIIVHEISAEFGWESYGIQVTRVETGERSTAAHVSVNAEKMMDLALQLQRNLVTPCSLREVLEDWL